MSSLIFENIINKINDSSENINSYFENIDLFNTNIYDIIDKIPKYNIIIYIFIIFLIFNFVSRLNIRLNEILTWMICILLIYFLIKKDYTQFILYTQDKKKQLNFLHKLVFNNKDIDYAKINNIIVKPIGNNQKSYLYLNPLIVQFFFNIREYSQYNISSYINSIICSNNVIGLDYQSKIGINKTYLNYESAIEETKKALNELNSVIYSIPSTIESYNKFDKSVKVLHGLLNKHIYDMSLLFKNENKTKDITISTMPNNFYDDYFTISADDTKTSDYISTFNMY